MPDLTVRTWVREQLIDVLSSIQRDAAREVGDIGEETMPCKHLSGFDSLNGVEAEVLLSERLGVELEDIEFIQQRTGQCSTVRQIVDAIVGEHQQALRLPNSTASTVIPRVEP